MPDIDPIWTDVEAALPLPAGWVFDGVRRWADPAPDWYTDLVHGVPRTLPVSGSTTIACSTDGSLKDDGSFTWRASARDPYEIDVGGDWIDSYEFASVVRRGVPMFVDSPPSAKKKAVDLEMRRRDILNPRCEGFGATPTLALTELVRSLRHWSLVHGPKFGAGAEVLARSIESRTRR
jgi:hypothetical protein